MVRFIARIVLVTLVSGSVAFAADKQFVLEVFMNGRDTGRVIAVRQRGPKLFASGHDLLSHGLMVSDLPTDHSKDRLIDLDDIHGMSYRLDMRSQALYLKAGRGVIASTQLSATNADVAKQVSPAAPGIVVNYDLVSTNGAGMHSNGGTLDMRAFDRFGVLSSGLQAVNSSNHGWSTSRLDTTYTYSNPGGMYRYRFGDVVTGGLAWSQPVRLGGIQFATDFSLRPDLVTYPVPSFGGTAAVPTTVSVLINGVQQMSKPIPAGPFDISQLPVTTGSGNVSVVMTDALGRQIVQTLPFYASPSLLKPGLGSLSAEVGSVRLDYASANDHYGSAAGELSYRRGITPWLTVEGHGEGSADVAMGGVGASLSVGDFGVVSVSAAGATAAQVGAGEQYMIGFEHINHVFSFSASTQRATDDFRDIATVNGDIPQRRLDRASLGFGLSRWGSLGVTYAGVKTNEQNVKLLSVSYSAHLIGSVSGYLTAFREMADGAGTGVFFSLTMPFGQRGSINAGTSIQGGQAVAELQASQSANTVGDAGWNVAVQGTGDARQQHVFGNVDYRSAHGLVGVGVDRMGRNTSAQVSAQGAVVLSDGSIFTANTVQDAFAVVETEPGVTVYNENRFVGKTGSNGRVLIPDLRSYQPNHVSIDPRDIPADADIEQAQHEIVPADRSSVTVRFPVHRSHGAVVRLVRSNGTPLVLGSTVLSEQGARLGTVGYEGKVYLENLESRNRVRVTGRDGFRCAASFEYKAARGDLPNIGPVTCK